MSGQTVKKLLPVAVVLVLLVWWLAGQVRHPAARMEVGSPPLLVPVQQGPLQVMVSASGSLQSADQAVIVNSLEGRSTILTIVPEGTEVNKGDVLITLDASSLQDKLEAQQIAVQNSEAAFVQARENLEIVKNQAQSDVEAAQLAATFARDDVEKYRLGEFPNKKKELRAKIAVNEEELHRAEEKLSWSKVLFKEKFLSQSELQADELAAKKARIDLELSKSNLNLFLKYTHTRRVKELQAEKNKTAMALERVRRKAAASVVQAEAKLKAKQAVLARERARLQKLHDELDKTRITAPRAGVVIYATSVQRNWRSRNEPLAPGQEVRERQELIYLPSTANMVAVVRIYESELNKVKVGQAARVYVDSVADEVFDGRVKAVAVFPDATSSWLNPDLKVYRAEIALEHGSRRLHSGMNCRVEIDVASYDNVVSVPIQAVISSNGKHYVYRERDGVVARQRVELGPGNTARVIIRSGVRLGDNVQLNPPLTSGDHQ